MFRITLLSTLVLSTLVGCTDDELRSALGEDEALEHGENLLEGLRDGDYEAYTRDFDDDMIGMVTPEVFTEVRTLVTELSGDYIAIDRYALEEADTRGYVTWGFDATFSDEPVWIGLTYPETRPGAAPRRGPATSRPPGDRRCSRAC